MGQGPVRLSSSCGVKTSSHTDRASDANGIQASRQADRIGGPPHVRLGSSPAVPARQRRGRSTSRSGLPNSIGPS
jgi:hypothetical protein